MVMTRAERRADSGAVEVTVSGLPRPPRDWSFTLLDPSTGLYLTPIGARKPEYPFEAINCDWCPPDVARLTLPADVDAIVGPGMALLFGLPGSVEGPIVWPTAIVCDEPVSSADADHAALVAAKETSEASGRPNRDTTSAAPGALAVLKNSPEASHTRLDQGSDGRPRMPRATAVGLFAFAVVVGAAVGFVAGRSVGVPTVEVAPRLERDNVTPERAGLVRENESLRRQLEGARQQIAELQTSGDDVSVQDNRLRELTLENARLREEAVNNSVIINASTFAVNLLELFSTAEVSPNGREVEQSTNCSTLTNRAREAVEAEDGEEAIFWTNVAARRYCPGAFEWLAYVVSSRPTDFSEPFAKAFHLYQIAAGLGSSNAIDNLERMARSAVGPVTDLEELREKYLVYAQ